MKVIEFRPRSLPPVDDFRDPDREYGIVHHCPRCKKPRPRATISFAGGSAIVTGGYLEFDYDCPCGISWTITTRYGDPGGFG